MRLAPSRRPASLLTSAALALCLLSPFAVPCPLRAQRQPEGLGRAVLALRDVDSGGNDPNNRSGTGANQVYGGAAVKRDVTPVSSSTNFVAPSATLDAGTTDHYVVTPSRLVSESAWSPGASAMPPPALSPMQSWRVTHFGAPESTGDAADTADPDGDGVVNLLEYALGSIPTDASSTALPSLQLSALGSPTSASFLSLTFARVADPSLTYTVQGADDLGATTWPAIWTSTGAETTAGPVTVTDTQPLSATSRRFLRLQVTAP